jgi:23S rRNA pseudouridine1911/1915/1917 synthase
VEKIIVLYEDNHLIAVYKPARVLVQADTGGETCLMDEVKKYLKEKYQKKGKVFLGLLHRLDRPVSGIVLFAKTSKGAGRLSEQFRNHSIRKIYQAVVEGKPKNNQQSLVNFLKKDEQKNKVSVFDKEVPGSQRAELFYKILQSHKKYSLLEIELKTGRSHQIRAQLAHIGCPIVGDVKYGASNPLVDKSIGLSAVELTFKLPTQEEMKTIKIESIESWKKFLK